MEDIIVREQESTTPFELGTWLGRHQALGWIASKCSAADAECLRTIRDRKLYRAAGVSWEDFCSLHAGMNRKTADTLIDRLEEFGASYFNLSQILHINAPEYRALAPAIEENVLEFEGERIPITRENSARIAAAVQMLRARAERPRARSRAAILASRLDACLGEICGLIRRGIADADLELLLDPLDDAARILEEIQANGEAIEPAA